MNFKEEKAKISKKVEKRRAEIAERKTERKIERNDKKIEYHIDKADKKVEKALSDAEVDIVNLFTKVDEELGDETIPIELISFKAIPLEYQKQVKDAVDSFKPGDFDARSFYNFVISGGMGGFLDKINDFINIIKDVK